MCIEKTCFISAGYHYRGQHARSYENLSTFMRTYIVIEVPFNLTLWVGQALPHKCSICCLKKQSKPSTQLFSKTDSLGQG